MASIAELDLADCVFAERVLRLICAALDARSEDILPAFRNQPPRRTALRAIWSYVLSAYMSNPRIAAIGKLDRTTVWQDVGRVVLACEESAEFDEWLDDVARLVEPLRNVIDGADRFVSVLVESISTGSVPKVITAPRRQLRIERDEGPGMAA